jgi:hypothetical protein
MSIFEADCDYAESRMDRFDPSGLFLFGMKSKRLILVVVFLRDCHGGHKRCTTAGKDTKVTRGLCPNPYECALSIC